MLEAQEKRAQLMMVGGHLPGKLILYMVVLQPCAVRTRKKPGFRERKIGKETSPNHTKDVRQKRATFDQFFLLFAASFSRL